MSFGKILVYVTAAVFVIYGVGFVFAPALLSELVTGSVPDTTSGMIDMRATYGGALIAIGALLGLLGSNPLWLKPGLLGVVFAMLGMASGRTYGILVDGSPNLMMWVFLALELVVAVAAIGALKRTD
jgi:hypothetical protein